jgi:hypothetical protein
LVRGLAAAVGDGNHDYDTGVTGRGLTISNDAAFTVDFSTPIGAATINDQNSIRAYDTKIDVLLAGAEDLGNVWVLNLNDAEFRAALTTAVTVPGQGLATVAQELKTQIDASLAGVYTAVASSNLLTIERLKKVTGTDDKPFAARITLETPATLNSPKDDGQPGGVISDSDGQLSTTHFASVQIDFSTGWTAHEGRSLVALAQQASLAHTWPDGH